MLDLRPVHLVGEQFVIDGAEDPLVEVLLLVVVEHDVGELVQALLIHLLASGRGQARVHEPLAQQADLRVRRGDHVLLAADRKPKVRVEELVEITELRHQGVTGFVISSAEPWPSSVKLNGSRSVFSPPLVNSLTWQNPSKASGAPSR